MPPRPDGCDDPLPTPAGGLDLLCLIFSLDPRPLILKWVPFPVYLRLRFDKPERNGDKGSDLDLPFLDEVEGRALDPAAAQGPVVARGVLH